MIIMHLHLKNIASFEDVSLDFSYPRRIKNSTIPYESLEGFDNFRFKRVNILMGANASGKSMCGRIICFIQNYINGKELLLCDERYINDKSQDAFFRLDFVTPYDSKMYQLEVTFNAERIINESLIRVPLSKNSSYEGMVKKIDILKNKIYLDTTYKNSIKSNDVVTKETDQYRIVNSNPTDDAIIKASRIFSHKKYRVSQGGWLYVISETPTEKMTNDYSITKHPINEDILNHVLTAFDKSIVRIEKIGETETRFLVTFHNSDEVIIEAGFVISNSGRISKGTHESINAAMIASEMKDRSASSVIYFADELIPHAHSEMEIAILNIFIGLLGKESQLFYTTHNHDVLDMNLPIHAFIFLKKDGIKTEIIYPSDSFKKNNRTLSNLVKNDVFGTVPDTSGIDGILNQPLNY